MAEGSGQRVIWHSLLLDRHCLSGLHLNAITSILIVFILSGQEVALSLPRLDADNTIHFLEHVVRCFPGRAILLLWDRAPWHKGKARQFIEAHEQLDMIYFPPGCPDLNPQEHVWKQTRDAVGHLWDYRHIGDLRQAFQTHLDHTFFHFDWIDKYLPRLLCQSVFIRS